MSIDFQVSVCNKKYTVSSENSGKLSATRYGEEWRDLTGDSLAYGLCARINKLESAIESALLGKVFDECGNREDSGLLSSFPNVEWAVETLQQALLGDHE